MKVILTEKVKSLGTIGEIVNVTAGYARNFLFPRQLAVLADQKNANVLKEKQKALAKKIEAEKKEALDIKKKVDGLTVELIKKVGTNGRLFGAVTTQEIARELETKGIHLERRLLQIEGSIKTLGTYDVKAKIFHDVVANFKVKVDIDAAMAEELKKQKEEAQRRNAEKKARLEAQKAEEAAKNDEGTEESEASEINTEA